MLFHLVWGCSIYVKWLVTDKFGPRSDKCTFIGYLKEIKRYFFYHADEQKVFVSLKAIFLGKEFHGEGTLPLRLNLMKFNR